jgi:hypothetical protein
MEFRFLLLLYSILYLLSRSAHCNQPVMGYYRYSEWPASLFPLTFVHFSFQAWSCFLIMQCIRYTFVPGFLVVCIRVACVTGQWSVMCVFFSQLKCYRICSAVMMMSTYRSVCSSVGETLVFGGRSDVACQVPSAL